MNRRKVTLIQFRSKNAEIATIIVGPDKDKFIIHQELLTYHSPYFRAALTGGFKEAKEKSVTLKDEHPRIFEFFMHWLYHGRLPNASDCVELFDNWRKLNPAGESCTDNHLIDLYVFCDKHQIHKLKLSLIGELVTFHGVHENTLPHISAVNHAFDHLPEKDPLNRYLVDVHAFYASDSVWDEEMVQRVSPKFLSSVMCKYAANNHGRNLIKAPDVCDYHDHENEEDKKACSATQKRRSE